MESGAPLWSFMVGVPARAVQLFSAMSSRIDGWKSRPAGHRYLCKLIWTSSPWPPPASSWMVRTLQIPGGVKKPRCGDAMSRRRGMKRVVPVAALRLRARCSAAYSCVQH
eukprot:893965-Pelagomonas_calceolata.AAC.6